MPTHDNALIQAQIETKVADLRGDIRLNTQGLENLRSRFDDLAAKMASVPVDLATLKERVAHLPTKDELGTKLRNYLAVATSVMGLLAAAIQWGPRLLGAH